MDNVTRMYREIGFMENHKNVNKFVKAVVINFGDERGDIFVENSNFGTDEEFADFTDGRKKSGLHPGQVVFSGIDVATAMKDRYIGPDDKIHTFGEVDMDENAEKVVPEAIDNADFFEWVQNHAGDFPDKYELAAMMVSCPSWDYLVPWEEDIARKLGRGSWEDLATSSARSYAEVINDLFREFQAEQEEE